MLNKDLNEADFRGIRVVEKIQNKKIERKKQKGKEKELKKINLKLKAKQ